MTSNTTEDQPEAVNVIDGFIPNEFLVEATANAFKFSVIVKQFFILQAGICVKMRRTMEKHLRNLHYLILHNYKVIVEQARQREKRKNLVVRLNVRTTQSVVVRRLYAPKQRKTTGQ